MQAIIIEEFIEKLDCEIFPITLIKFMLNKRKILYYFSRAAEPNFDIRGLKYQMDHTNCPVCKQKQKDMGVLCRQHTSLERILNTDKVVLDIDTNSYFYKNEIFRLIDDKLVVVYCPHTSLIMGNITDLKVRKVIPCTFVDDNIQLKFKIVRQFISSELMSKNMKCWFNEEFSLVTIPKDMDQSDFCLIPNK